MVRPEIMLAGVLVTVAVLSAILTGVVRRVALSHGLMDVPTDRSSHSLPTPRGGGLAILAATLLAFSLLLVFGHLRMELFAALAGGGLAIGIVGFIDDRKSLPVWVRLLVHIGAAAWAMAWLDGAPSLLVNDQVVSLGVGGYVLGTLTIVWTLNLFNFMDGIDGIAASEGVFVAGAGAALAFLAGWDSACLPAAALAAACLGFLKWNWPKAKIFMGDAGSGYIGYLLAVLALASAHEDPAALWTWFILGGVFWIDATVTLTRRLARGEPVFRPHRSHAYQWLSRRWQGHLPVTLTTWLVNVLWLLPFAWWSSKGSEYSLFLLAVAWLPLIALVVWAGAGRREMTTP